MILSSQLKFKVNNKTNKILVKQFLLSVEDINLYNRSTNFGNNNFDNDDDGKELYCVYSREYTTSISKLYGKNVKELSDNELNLLDKIILKRVSMINFSSLPKRLLYKSFDRESAFLAFRSFLNRKL